MQAFYKDSEKKVGKIALDENRTHILEIRRQTPYPSGHAVKAALVHQNVDVINALSSERLASICTKILVV